MRQSRWNRKAFWRQTSAKYPNSFFAKTERPHPSPPNVTHRFSSTLVANGPMAARACKLLVQDVAGDKPALALNIGTPMNPASTIKLLTNLLWFVSAAAIGEGLMLGAKAGIPLHTVWEAIKSSAGNSWVAEHDVPSIFAGHYDPSFSLALCCKDLGLINGIAKSQGYDLPMGGMAQQLFQQAMATYGPDAAELHVVKLLEERVGHMLRP